MNTAEPFSGWLYKWTNLIKGYKKRWFLIQDNLLSYYREPDAIGRHCRGTFNLTNAYLSVQNSGSSFSLTESCGRKHHFKALSEEEKEKWIAVLTESISRSQGPHTDIESDYSSCNVLRREKEINCKRNSFKLTLKGRSKLDLKTTSFPALPQQFTDQSLSLSSYPCSGQLCPHDHLSNSGFNEKSRRTKQDLSRSNNRFTASAPLSNSFSLPTCEPNISTYDLKTKADTGRRLSRQQHVISIEDSNRLETIESIKKRLQDHINNICFQVSNIESMLTSVSTDLSSLLHHSRSLPLNLNDQLFVSDLDRRTTSLKLALLEHRSDAKDFYETSTEALQLLTGTYTRFSRQLTLEQERCITLERTVEQLAKELRSLEIQLRNHIPVVAEKKNINEIQLEESNQSTKLFEKLFDEENDEFFDAISVLDVTHHDSLLSTTINQSTPKKRRAKTATISCHNSSLPTHSDVIHASSTSLSSLANVEESSISFSDSELPNGFTNIALRNGAIESIQSDGYRNVYKRNSATGQHNGTLKYVNNTGRIRKRRSTIPVSPKIALNLWGIIKNAIGKDLSKIPIPVNFNEPLSFLQRAVEDFTYSSLLDQAAQTTDPVEQMAYVVAFSVSCYSSTAYRIGKPFNSLLGETYECDRTDDMGWRCISEQVSHHPPGCSQYCESLRHKWKVWQDYFLSTKFRGKYLSISPKGTINLQFADGSYFTWTKATTVVHNLIVGTLWIDNCGDVIIENHKNGFVCNLQFIAHSYFSRGPSRRVTGFVKNSTGLPVAIIQGTWDDHIEYQRLSIDKIPVGEPKVVWKADTLPPNASDMYHFSRFAIELNEMEDGVAPTDSRNRPDQRLMEQGFWDQANEEKRRLELKQRNKRHAWERAVKE
ncbi:Oxysterol-binding protein, partial [Schistosoma japonicum]